MPRRYRPKKRPFFKKKNFWKLIFLLIFFSGLFYFFFLSSFFEIKVVEVKGQEKIKESEVKNFVKKGNIFLFDPKFFGEDLKKKFIYINEVKIEKKFPNKIVILIEERKPEARVCKEGQNCFFVSLDGMIFEKADFKENSDLILEIKNENPQIGKKIIEKEVLEALLLAKKNLKNLEIEIEKIVLEEGTILIFTNLGFKIYLSKNIELKKALEALFLILKKNPEIKNSNYIDLRSFEAGKVYFK